MNKELAQELQEIVDYMEKQLKKYEEKELKEKKYD